MFPRQACLRELFESLQQPEASRDHVNSGKVALNRVSATRVRPAQAIGIAPHLVRAH